MKKYTIGVKHKFFNPIKKLISLALILILSLNSFAAVIADNDGSAFITKAEFDSLKNNFQAQIDSYNTSIDSKIDGAIASYLSGIQIEKNYVEVNELYNLVGTSYVQFAYPWTVPDTRKGTHAKMGINLVLKPAAALILPTGTTMKNGNITINGTSYPFTFGEFEIRLGLLYGTATTSKWPADSLFVGEYPTTINPEHRTVMYRTYDAEINENTYRYTTLNDAYELTPYTMATAAKTGGSASQIKMPMAPNADTATANPLTVSFADTTFPDWAGNQFGNTTATWNFQVQRMCSTSATMPQTGTVDLNATGPVVFDCLAENTTSATIARNRINWKCLSGGSVPNATYYGVHDSDWNTADSTAFATGDQWQAYEFSGYIKTYDNNSVGENSDHPSAANTKTEWKVPDVHCYLKKYNQYNVQDNIMYAYSIIEQQPIYYYNGVPLVKAKNKGKLKITLKTVYNYQNDKFFFGIRDSAFPNTDDVTGNVEITDLSGNKTYLFEQSTGSGSAGMTKVLTFYIDTVPGKTYWIKFHGNTEGKITRAYGTVPEFQGTSE